jgi:hypothetical protein
MNDARRDGDRLRISLWIGSEVDDGEQPGASARVKSGCTELPTDVCCLCFGPVVLAVGLWFPVVVPASGARGDLALSP